MNLLVVFYFLIFLIKVYNILYMHMVFLIYNAFVKLLMKCYSPYLFAAAGTKINISRQYSDVILLGGNMRSKKNFEKHYIKWIINCNNNPPNHFFYFYDFFKSKLETKLGLYNRVLKQLSILVSTVFEVHCHFLQFTNFTVVISCNLPLLLYSS